MFVNDKMISDFNDPRPRQWDPAHFPPGTVVVADFSIHGGPITVTVDYLSQNGIYSWLIHSKEQAPNFDGFLESHVFNIDHVTHILSRGKGNPIVKEWASQESSGWMPTFLPNGYSYLVSGDLRELVWQTIKEERKGSLHMHHYIISDIANCVREELQYSPKIQVEVGHGLLVPAMKTKAIKKAIKHVLPRMRTSKKVLIEEERKDNETFYAESSVDW